MARLSRKLRVCKWAGTVGCVLIGVAFVINGWWTVRISWVLRKAASGGGPSAQKARVAFEKGLFEFERTFHARPVAGPPSCELSRNRQFGWSFARRFPIPAIYHEHTDLSHYKNPRGNPAIEIDHVSFPLWLPLVVLLIPTLLLWWRDRKPRPGHCRRCGYDLTGNVSGICPECGATISEKQRKLLGCSVIGDNSAVASSSPHPALGDGVGHPHAKTWNAPAVAAESVSGRWGRQEHEETKAPELQRDPGDVP